MITLFKPVVILICLTLTLGISSCQEASTPGPDQSVATPSVALSDVISPGLSQKYTLIKHGQAALAYNADGHLWRATYGVDARGSLATRKTYTYSAGMIKAVIGSGMEVYGEETYWLEANTGRCSASKVLTYLYSNSTLANVVERVYQYNDKGQLKTCADKVNPAERTEYTYAATGDLSKATRSGAPQFAYPVIVLDVTTFLYDQPAGDPVLSDQYPLNDESTGLPDEYLRIFGKPSKHLVKLVTHSGSGAGSYYTYILNADGYVTERKEYNLSGGALVNTKPYSYLITALVANL